jgi:hypothetical protein
MGLSHGVDFANFMGGYWQRNHGEEGHGGSSGSGYWSPIHLNMAMGARDIGSTGADYDRSVAGGGGGSGASSGHFDWKYEHHWGAWGAKRLNFFQELRIMFAITWVPGESSPNSFPIYPNIPTLSGSDYKEWPTQHGEEHDDETLRHANDKRGIWGKRKYYRLIDGNGSGDASGMHGPNAYVWVTPKPASLTRKLRIPRIANRGSNVELGNLPPNWIDPFDAVIKDENNNFDRQFQIYYPTNLSREGYLFWNTFTSYFGNKATVPEPVPDPAAPNNVFIFILNYLTW